MKTKIQLHAILLSLCLLPTAPCLAASPTGTAFTYQGRLNDAGQPANGAYDLRFALFDTAQAGAGVGVVVTNVSTPVVNGLFTVTLDFGLGVFTGDARWIEIGVRTNGAASFLTLAPRQTLTPAPQALFAPTAGVAASATTAGSTATANGVTANAVTAAGIASGQVVKSLNNLRDNVTLAAGANLTLSPVAQTITLATPEDWHVGGNSGTTPGTQFVGTTDNQPLELKVNNQRAFRLQPGAAPSVIGGAVTNAVHADTSGATIGGGAGHAIGLKADYSTIGGGGNIIESNTACAVIAGGTNNQILTATNRSSQAAVIGGGNGNTIEPWAFQSAIAGGYRNRIQYDADSVAIGGGEGNVIGTNADSSVIVGGAFNTVSNSATYATVTG